MLMLPLVTHARRTSFAGVKWGYTRLHFNSPTELSIEFVSNGIGFKNVSENGVFVGVPVPGPAVPTVEDRLRISKPPYTERSP